MARAQTPLQLARAECCLYDHRGNACWALDGPCRLALNPLERCPYFETAILPQAKQSKPHRQVAGSYYEALGGSLPAELDAVRTCPDCNSPLPKRQRYCAACAAKRRRKSYRNSKKGKRVG